ncbi:hypothetical protein SOJ_19880 [Staphylococcus sp. OJ82]|nr:hypothetical protein SE1039_09160 [Staphylococcus equorum]ANK37652.1 hypothetical protein AOB58_850 [Staphylococcus sp. AntiMn-1]EJX17699.1 hypothetical protein SOJ_19880 [Staphylococcus sp. OJ82]
MFSSNLMSFKKLYLFLYPSIIFNELSLEQSSINIASILSSSIFNAPIDSIHSLRNNSLLYTGTMIDSNFSNS